MASIKIICTNPGENDSTIIFDEILRFHENYEKDHKELIVELSNEIAVDNKLAALASGSINEIILTEGEDIIILTEYTEVKMINKIYYGNGTASKTRLQFENKY